MVRVETIEYFHGSAKADQSKGSFFSLFNLTNQKINPNSRDKKEIKSKYDV